MAVCTILSILDLSPADAAVGEVMDGKFFFAVEEPIKEGTMPTVALAAGSDAYPAGYHVGNVGGLPAIDGDLVAGNIKNGVTIFDTLGTFESVLAEDVLGHHGNQDIVGAEQTVFRHDEVLGAGADFTMATKTLDYNDPSLTVGAAVCFGMGHASLKIRLIMDGVQVAETATAGETRWTVAQGTRALTGETICFAQMHNYDAEIPKTWYTYGQSSSLHIAGEILVGSVKI